MTQEEALDYALEQSGAYDDLRMLMWFFILLIAFFIIRYFVNRAKAKAQVQKDILAELRKANTVNNSKT